MFSRNCRKYAQDTLNYAKKFSYCLTERNLSDICGLSDEKRLHVLKGLSALSKFLGLYEYWQRMVKAYDLKWSSRSVDDLIIARLTRSKDSREIFQWVKLVKKKVRELSVFLDYVTASGLRQSEAITSFNLIIELGKTGKLDQYYNHEKQILEHFRFRELFLRRTKKCYISFVRSEMIEKIVNDKTVSPDIINGRLKRRKIHRRFSDLREAFATLATRHLSQPEADFIQGRVGKSVFMRAYFNPALIADLKDRALKVGDEMLRGI